jgi:thymidylate synthase (FAD)
VKAELIDHMGSDLTVVNAARVSFDKESKGQIDWVIDSDDGKWVRTVQVPTTADARLISYLARHNHYTPFTHPQITLRETVPIFVARQRFKHVVGFTYNEVSRRYVDSEPEFYTPNVWRKRADDKKQGSSDEAVDEPLVPYWHSEVIFVAMNAYRNMLARGVCPEQARMVLPQSMMTSYYVTGSLAAFARAYKLRIDPHAQVEIQVLAKEWDRIIRPLFPVSWEALTHA